MKDLKSELTGDTEEAVLALMMPPAEYDALCLHEALADVTDHTLIINILFSKTGAELEEIKKAYKRGRYFFCSFSFALKYTMF